MIGYSRGGIVIRQFNQPYKIHTRKTGFRYLELKVNGKRKVFPYNELVKENKIPPKKAEVEIFGLDNLFIDRAGNIFSRKSIEVLPYTCSDRPGLKKVGLMKNGMAYNKSLEKLVRQNFGEDALLEGLIESKMSPLPDFDGYYIDLQGNIYNEEMKPVCIRTNPKNGIRFVYLWKYGKKIYRKIDEFMLLVNMSDYLPIPGFESYKMSPEGKVFNKFGTEVMPGHFKDRYGGIVVRIQLTHEETGLRRGPFLGNLIATTLIPNPNGFKNVKFLDGDCKNCHPKNIVWQSESERAAKITKTLKARYSNTREYAVNNCSDPELIEYYQTLDKLIIER